MVSFLVCIYGFTVGVIEDNTWLRGDMQFIFECSTRHRFEHEKRNFISSSAHVSFCLFYKPSNNEVLDDFPKISEDFQNVVRWSYECFRTFSKFCRKFRRFPMIAEEDPKMVRLNIGKLWFIQHWNMANSSANVKSISSHVDMVFLSKGNPGNSV